MLLIAAPLLTMRSFAEERKNRMDQLLDSTGQPVSGCYGKIPCDDYHFRNPMCGISVISFNDQDAGNGLIYYRITYLSWYIFYWAVYILQSECSCHR